MLKFIELESNRDMLQFIVNLLYLGMKSNNVIWAESNGTEQAVKDLLSTISDSFIKVANDILLNGSIRINSDQRLAKHGRIPKDVEEYQDIVDILRDAKHEDDFSRRCKSHFERLTEKFSIHKDLSVLR